MFLGLRRFPRFPMFPRFPSFVPVVVVIIIIVVVIVVIVLIMVIVLVGDSTVLVCLVSFVRVELSRLFVFHVFPDSSVSVS